MLLRQRPFLAALLIACIAAAIAALFVARGGAIPHKSRRHAAGRVSFSPPPAADVAEEDEPQAMVAFGSVDRQDPPVTPSAALARLVDAAVRGNVAEAERSFPGRGASFVRQWHGRLPAGRVTATSPDGADSLNAGAESGRLQPVTVWIAGEDQTAALTGEALFLPGSRGWTVDKVHLEPVPLQVASWSQAAARVGPGASRRAAGTLEFHGQFRLDRRGEAYAVDAITGRIERE